jgi:hypothetical protein
MRKIPKSMSNKKAQRFFVDETSNLIEKRRAGKYNRP